MKTKPAKISKIKTFSLFLISFNFNRKNSQFPFPLHFIILVLVFYLFFVLFFCGRDLLLVSWGFVLLYLLFNVNQYFNIPIFSWGLSVIFPCGNYCSNYRGSGTFGVTALFELSHSHTISYRNKKIVPFPLP